MFLAGNAEEHTDWTAAGHDITGSIKLDQSKPSICECPRRANQRAALKASRRRGLFASLLHLSVFSCWRWVDIITSGTSPKCGGRADPRGRSRARVSMASLGEEDHRAAEHEGAQGGK